MSRPMVRGTSIDTELDTRSLDHQRGIRSALTKPTAMDSCRDSGRARPTNLDTLDGPLPSGLELVSFRDSWDIIRARSDVLFLGSVSVLPMTDVVSRVEEYALRPVHDTI